MAAHLQANAARRPSGHVAHVQSVRMGFPCVPCPDWAHHALGFAMALTTTTTAELGGFATVTSGDGGSRLLGRPPPFDPHVSGENIAAVLVDSLSNGVR